MFTGYQLTKDSRNKLLELFPPKYERVICHHITEKFGVDAKYPAPEQPRTVDVIGYINSGDGVEGLLVAVNGSTDRPDGKHYHITLSLANNRTPVETNNYTNTAKPIAEIPITVEAKNFHK